MDDVQQLHQGLCKHDVNDARSNDQQYIIVATQGHLSGIHATNSWEVTELIPGGEALHGFLGQPRAGPGASKLSVAIRADDSHTQNYVVGVIEKSHPL